MTPGEGLADRQRQIKEAAMAQKKETKTADTGLELGQEQQTQLLDDAFNRSVDVETFESTIDKLRLLQQWVDKK